MNLLKNFTEFILKEDLFLQKSRLLLAVSGGMDSVVLCELCKRAAFDFSIAHCNFQLRDEESERDEKFTKELAEKYKAPLFIKKFETEKFAAENKISIQVAARELRYAWFYELLNISKTDVILTAHHLDDNIETMLMNFFKGTGIAGLRGMLPQQGKIVRPLLFAKKEELKVFAEENNLMWVEDSSNAGDKYSRNYLRLSVIPLIEKIFPQVISNLADNQQRFRDIESIYNEAVQSTIKKLVELHDKEIHIPVLKLKKTKAIRTIVYEIIRNYGFTPKQVDEVLHLLDSETGKYILSPAYRILKNRNWLIIGPVHSKDIDHVLIEKNDAKISFGNHELTMKSKSDYQEADNCTALLDASNIQFPLLIRRWKPGDYFYPLGMRKKKKVARFFIDQKLSRAQKEDTWVLEMDKKILWVVGMRIDDRYKVTSGTRQVLEIKFSQKVEK